ncbi:phosphatase PAP2 family protein [Mucilaginibacter antarcticus]|uniref:phosphatase PAP2 family protein n=1 Tax=Mucilaginibacter antarcticus TaxID=1855725 RepID=UPI0036441BB7
MKQLIKRPRPYDAYPNFIFQKGDASGYSLPSGHTSVAFATATSLSLSFPKWYVIVPAFTYAGAVGMRACIWAYIIPLMFWQARLRCCLGIY